MSSKIYYVIEVLGGEEKETENISSDIMTKIFPILSRDPPKNTMKLKNKQTKNMKKITSRHIRIKLLETDYKDKKCKSNQKGRHITHRRTE